MRTGVAFAAIVCAATAGSTLSAYAGEKKYSTGASDTEIKIGHTTAYSGPVSSFGTIGRTLVAYFNMVNAAGGINGREIRIISLDDAYSPPKAVEQTRKLVEQDEVLAISTVPGSPTNAATQKYLNSKGVPQILITTGAAKFNNPKAFPWTMPFWPSYGIEQKTYIDYVEKVKPGAKVAVLYANDDYGKDHLAGLVAAIAAAKNVTLVAQASYESSDATVDSQILKLKSSGADVFVSATTPKFAAQAIRKVREVGWDPLHFVANASSSISAVMEPAGLDNAKGVVTTAFIKLPSDPRWSQDKEVVDYLAFMKARNPQDNPHDFFPAVTYASASMLHHVLRTAGDDLTRENIMRIVSNLHDVHPALFLQKIVVKTTPDDLSAFKSLQLQQFNGKTWVDLD